MLNSFRCLNGWDSYRCYDKRLPHQFWILIPSQLPAHPLHMVQHRLTQVDCPAVPNPEKCWASLVEARQTWRPQLHIQEGRWSCCPLPCPAGPPPGSLALPSSPRMAEIPTCDISWHGQAPGYLREGETEHPAQPSCSTAYGEGMVLF